MRARGLIDTRMTSIRGRPLAWLAILLLTPALLLANGGTLRIANVEVGPYSVTAFTDPTPVRTDTLDISLLITRMGSAEIVPGLAVTLRAEPIGHEGVAKTEIATREAADDPRYYAAKFALGTPGSWRISIAVQGPEGGGETAFEVNARDLRPLDNPLILIIVALLPLFLAAWWFLRKPPEPEGVTAGETRSAG